MDDRCNRCNGTGRVPGASQLSGPLTPRSDNHGQVPCGSCGGTGVGSSAHHVASSVAGRSGDEGAFFKANARYLPYAIAPLGLWAALMAAWDIGSAQRSSHPDWFVVGALVLPIIVTVIFRRHVRWLALGAVVAALAALALLGNA